MFDACGREMSWIWGNRSGRESAYRLRPASQAATLGEML
jgi:hypothetical protein